MSDNTIASTGPTGTYTPGTTPVPGLGQVPVGGGCPWFTNTAPDGWLLCQGQAVSRTTYSRLFAVIGTAYGDGDGSTTFNLPDLRQRFPLGRAASGTGDTLAATGGAIDHQHGAAGTHAHDAAGGHTHTSAGAHTHDAHVTDSFALVADGTAVHVNPATHSSDGGHTHDTIADHSHSSTPDHSHPATNPPFLVLNFIIYTGVGG